MSKLYTNPDDYYRDHKVCPSCRGESLSSTLMGFVFRSGKPFKDTNRVTCHCGWSGTTHDLVPKPVRRKLEKSKADKILARVKKSRKSDNRLYQTLQHRADILSVVKHMTQLLDVVTEAHP